MKIWPVFYFIVGFIMLLVGGIFENVPAIGFAVFTMTTSVIISATEEIKQHIDGKFKDYFKQEVKILTTRKGKN